MKGPRKNILLLLLESLIAFSLFIIFIISLTGTHHNIAWYKEFFVTMCILLIILASCIWLNGKEAFLQKKECKILAGILVIWFVLLYLFSCWARNSPVHDYAAVYNSAYNFAYKKEAVDWAYFARWKNNFPLFLILSTLMRLCHLAHIQDPFYFLLLCNTSLTVWGGLCTYRIVRKKLSQKSLAIIVLLFYIAFVPCWGGTGFFYTDSTSIAFSVWAANMLISPPQNTLPHGLLAGCLWGIGFSIKATAAISMIAILLICLLTPDNTRLKRIGGILSGFIFIVLFWNGIRMNFPCHEMEEEYAAPLEYWIGLGLNANGSYSENQHFALTCLEISGSTEKEKYARQYIATHIQNFWSAPHLISKIRCNFASGQMGLADFSVYPINNAYEFFNSFGKYNGYTTMVTTGYFYALWLLGMSGQCIDLIQLQQNKISEISFFYVPQLTVWGLYLFLMLWEANNRQLYNHIPWFCLFAVMGLYKLLSLRSDAMRSQISSKVTGA